MEVPKSLNEYFDQFIETCLNYTNGVVIDFVIVGQAPYFKEITKPEARGLTREDFFQMFSEKISVFFNICGTVRISFIKNRRFKSITKIYNSNIPDLYIGIYKNKFLYLSKFTSVSPNAKKNDLVKSRVFSIFGDSSPNLLKIIGWLKHSKCLYFVYEYIDTTLGYYLKTNPLNRQNFEKLKNEIINAIKYLNHVKKLFFTKSSILIRESLPVFPVIPSEIQDLNSQNKHLSTELENLPDELRNDILKELFSNNFTK